jgi:hypothetical protein
MRTYTEWIQYFNSKRGEVFTILYDVHLYGSKKVTATAGTNIIVLSCCDWRAGGIATGAQVSLRQDTLLSFEVLLDAGIHTFRLKPDGLKIL